VSALDIPALRALLAERFDHNATGDAYRDQIARRRTIIEVIYDAAPSLLDTIDRLTAERDEARDRLACSATSPSTARARCRATPRRGSCARRCGATRWTW